MLTKLRELLTRRQQEHRRANADALVEAFLIEARRRLGLENIELDGDYVLGLLNERNLSLDDFEANVQFVMKRFNWKQNADQEADLKAKHEQLQKDTEAFDVAEATRHREALKKLQEMQSEVGRSRNRWMVAFEARLNLESTAAPADDLTELESQRKAKLSEKQELQIALNPNDLASDDGSFDASYLAANVSKRPARLVRQLRATLSDGKVGHSNERKQELNSQLRAAERRVQECGARLAQLNIELAALDSRMKLGADALDPANFSLIRARPTLDEEAKRRAIDAGWHGGPGVVSTLDHLG